MEQAIRVGYGLLVGVCWVLGLRALRTARTSGSAIDWALAIVCISAGGLGCPLSFLPSMVPLEPYVRARVLAAGIGGLGFASAALYFALWRYFRPRSVLAALFCSAGSFAIAWSLLAEVATAGFAWGHDRRWLALGGVACGLPYAWGAVEMLREACRLRRHSRIGFDDATAGGFLPYGLALGIVALGYGAGIASAYRHPGEPHPPAVVAMVAVVGFLAAIGAAIGFYWSLRRRGSPTPPTSSVGSV